MNIDSIAIMSARYSHTRNTGATYSVIQNLKSGVWDMMSIDAKRKLLKESKESQFCSDDWESFIDWVKDE